MSPPSQGVCAEGSEVTRTQSWPQGCFSGKVGPQSGSQVYVYWRPACYLLASQ